MKLFASGNLLAVLTGISLLVACGGGDHSAWHVGPIAGSELPPSPSPSPVSPPDGVAGGGGGAASDPHDIESQKRAADLVAQMTLDQKFQWIRGDHKGNMSDGPEGGAGHMPGIPSLKIPDIYINDSATGSASLKFKSTTFPAPILVAASWDPKVSYQHGAAIAKQLHAQGFNLGLGGGVNLVRDPRAGRTFEYLGEDPVLAGLMVAQRTQGTQDNKVIATVKHMLGNEQETRRTSSVSSIDMRTLRELYMLPFQIALKTAAPGNIMCSYNRLSIDGAQVTEACANRLVITDILKKELGFKGQVQTDWDAVHPELTTTAAVIDAGVDEEGSIFQSKVFTPERIKENPASLMRLDDMVKRKMYAMIKAGVMDDATRFDPRSPTKAIFGNLVEAEDSLLSGGTAVATNHEGFTGKGFVDHLWFSGASISFDVTGVPSDGPFLLQMRYANGHGKKAYATVKINEGPEEQQIEIPRTTWDAWGVASLPVTLKAGNNKISIAASSPESDNSINVDSVAITAVSSDYPAPNTASLPPAPSIDFEAAAVASQQIAEQGMVLLQNAQQRQQGSLPASSQNLLPLDAKSVKSIAVIGPNVDSAILQGGGSAEVRLPVWGSIAGCGSVKYFAASPKPGCGWWKDPWLKVRTSIKAAIQGIAPGANVTFGGHADTGNPFRPYTEEEIRNAVEQARTADVAIVVAHQIAGEDGDLGTLSLRNAGACNDDGSDCRDNNQDRLIAEVAAENKNTIVVLMNGNPVLMPWRKDVTAVLEAWYPGENGGPAIANILFGQVNPSGKLPLTFPISDEKTPTGGGPFAVNPTYSEKLNIGYRWYDARNEAPLFPFGFGLSYTEFSYANLVVDTAADGSKTASFTVTNSGKVAGQEIAQVYMSFPPAFGEPPKRLVGWQKLALAPGQSQVVTVSISPQFQSYWNVDRKSWSMMAGGSVLVGASSRDIRLSN